MGDVMDNAKVNEALRACKGAIRDHVGCELDPDRNQTASNPHAMLRHVLWMIGEAQSWLDERLEKKYRWLGFVQGVLWTMGIQTIEQAKRQNMPEVESFVAERR